MRPNLSRKLNASSFEAVQQSVVVDDVLNELGEGQRLEGFARGFVGNHARAEIDRHGVARSNGFGVLICAAGMAAHLAGAFAANSTLPVIGIPMKGGAGDGLDALLSTVQMPSGIPVATVALGGAKNAAVLAAEILAVSDDALAAKLDEARAEMARQIAGKEARLQEELAH